MGRDQAWDFAPDPVFNRPNDSFFDFLAILEGFFKI